MGVAVLALLVAASCSSDPASGTGSVDAAPLDPDASPLGDPDAALPPSSAVRGTLVGLGQGVELPADHECEVLNGAGSIADEDVTVEVRCRNAQLAAIDMSAPARFEPLFQPTVDSYEVVFSIVAQVVEIRAAAAHPDGIVRIDGVGDGPVATASRSRPIGDGPDVEITVTAGTAVRTYALDLQRVRIAEEEASFTSPRPEVAGVFGDTIAADGDTLVVGVFTDPSGASGVNGDESDTSMPDAGAVHVYRRGVGGWQREASVAIEGDVIAVGAPAQDGGGGWASGAIYVFAGRWPDGSRRPTSRRRCRGRGNSWGRRSPAAPTWSPPAPATSSTTELEASTSSLARSSAGRRRHTSPHRSATRTTSSATP